jgi:hypothetical protein
VLFLFLCRSIGENYTYSFLVVTGTGTCSKVVLLPYLGGFLSCVVESGCPPQCAWEGFACVVTRGRLYQPPRA